DSRVRCVESPGSEARCPSPRMGCMIPRNAHLRILGLALVACVAIAVIACGNGAPAGSSSGPPAAPVGKIVHGIKADAKVKGTDALVFDPNSAKVSVNGVVEFDNSGSVFHNITFPGHDDLNDANFAGGGTWQI